MNFIDLDFYKEQKKSFARHIIFLVLAIVAGLITSYFAYIYYQDIKMLEEAVFDANYKRQKQNQKPVSNYSESIQSAEALKNGMRISKQLNTPWDHLFSSIEYSNFNDIAILELLPEAASGKLRITGEARDQKSLTTYLNTLWRIKGFLSVYLVQQKVNDQIAEHPIKFVIDITWRRDL